MPSGRSVHKNAAPKIVKIAVISISDSRSLKTDKSGDYLEQEIKTNKHILTKRVLIKDDFAQIKQSFVELLESNAEVIISTGGTGISGRDNTITAVESLIKKPLPGFGELFRMLSYKEVKAAAMLSRATAGLAEGGLIFALPGSVNAVKTAWDKLLKEELGHLVYEVLRHKQAF